MRIQIWYAQLRQSNHSEHMLKNAGILALRVAADPSLGPGQAQRHPLLSANFQHGINTLAPLVHRLHAFLGHGLERRFLL